MKTRLTLKPGARGTRKLLAEHGKALVCVRYRYDERLRRRYKTVELIVDERAWDPNPRAKRIVAVRIGYREERLRERIKKAGGRWDREAKTWRITYNKAVQLGLRKRIVPDKSI